MGWEGRAWGCRYLLLVVSFGCFLCFFGVRLCVSWRTTSHAFCSLLAGGPGGVSGGVCWLGYLVWPLLVLEGVG